MKTIPLSCPDVADAERKAVLDILRESSLALGPKGGEFEKKMATYIGAKHAVAVNSGTSGLHLLIRALGIKEGDEVITTPFSFVASANCVLFEKATPIFIDIDLQTLNIDPDRIEGVITKKTKAILAVDVFGYPAEWKKISTIAKKHNLKIIEDSCEALGAEYYGKKCGNFGDAAVFAFYPNKQITTGEGGVIVTNSNLIEDLCRSMSNQGRESRDNKWLEHIRLGYNYRMSEINASLGVAQLSRIDDILEKRECIATRYNDLLGKVGKIKLPCANDDNHKRSWFVYVVILSEKYSRQDRDLIIEMMGKRGIQCGNYFQCIHLQPFYRREFKYDRGMYPIAEFIADRTIALPFFNGLKKEDIDYVVGCFKEIINKIN
jgi:perosamine synthetase